MKRKHNKDDSTVPSKQLKTSVSKLILIDDILHQIFSYLPDVIDLPYVCKQFCNVVYNPQYDLFEYSEFRDVKSIPNDKLNLVRNLHLTCPYKKAVSLSYDEETMKKLVQLSPQLMHLKVGSYPSLEHLFINLRRLKTLKLENISRGYPVITADQVQTNDSLRELTFKLQNESYTEDAKLDETARAIFKIAANCTNVKLACGLFVPDLVKAMANLRKLEVHECIREEGWRAIATLQHIEYVSCGDGGIVDSQSCPPNSSLKQLIMHNRPQIYPYGYGDPLGLDYDGFLNLFPMLETFIIDPDVWYVLVSDLDTIIENFSELKRLTLTVKLKDDTSQNEEDDEQASVTMGVDLLDDPHFSQFKFKVETAVLAKVLQFIYPQCKTELLDDYDEEATACELQDVRDLFDEIVVGSDAKKKVLEQLDEEIAALPDSTEENNDEE